MKRLSALVLILLFALGALAVTGCNEKDDAGKGTKAPTTTEKSKEVNANWTIEVDDKHTIDQDGLPIDYTLQLTATKAGGTSPIGSYKGTAHFVVKADVSKFKGLPQSVVKVMGSIDGVAEDKALTFKVIDFQAARKANSEKAGSNKSGDAETPLATLVPPGKGSKTTNTLPEPTEEDKAVSNPDYYSFGYMEMKGMGKLDIQAKGIQGESAQYTDQKTASDKVSFSMNIVGATVYIDIPNAGRFKGTVTGDPIE